MATTITTPFLLLILFILINSISIPSSFSCPLHQKQALLNIKSNSIAIFNVSPSYLDYSFPSWSPNSDCCHWAGVICDETNSVNEFSLSGLLPSFDKPTSVFFDILTPLFHIRSLELLNISYSHLVGEIPENWFGNLTQLVYLDLSSNNFNGSIPYQIFGLTNLRYLDMSYNSFEGNLVPELGKLQNLEWLDLSWNSLTGNIPQEIGNLTKLGSFYLQDNFSGGIPCSIANMKDLEEVEFSNNAFSMKIPTCIGRLPLITRLALSNNQLTGQIPSSIHNLSRLELLWLQDNYLTGEIQLGYSFKGSIPTIISNFTNLRILDLSANKVTGSIPHEIASLIGMIETPVHMATSGTIFEEGNYPRNIYLLDGIKFDIEDLIVNWKNSFQGLSSHSVDVYSLLDLSNNRISGEIPASLGNLKSLKLLNISNNIISGNIPMSFGNLKGMESLDLSHNKISGSIPQSLEKLDELGILDVSNNRLTGKIPMGGHMSTMNGLKYFANNNGLCSMQINITCPEDIPPPSEGREDDEDDENLSWIFWVGTWIGFPIGFFSSILIMGYILNFLLLFKLW